MPIQLLFVVLAVLFAQSALAQQFYKWKDQKGQWHYSDFPPSGRWRNWEPVILLKHWRYNRPFPPPVSKEKRKIVRVVRPKARQMLTY